MTRTEITESVRFGLASNLLRKIDTIHMHSNLRNDLGMDDVDLLETMMELENVYKIIIGQEQFEKLHTVKDLVDFLAAHTSKQAGLVVDGLYGVDGDTFYPPSDRYGITQHIGGKGFYADEHNMCFGVAAFSQSERCRRNNPAWPGIYASKQWLRLV